MSSHKPHAQYNASAEHGEMVQQSLPFAMIHGEAVVNKPQDLFIPPDALEIILEVFEGPLDLLLYLIRKQKFDILDLPIAPITEQYMQYVELMKAVKLELAAEYLVMAAILAEIKSRMLLPKQTIVEEEQDPRAELVRRLQEYEVIKSAAQQLDELPRIGREQYLPEVTLADNFTAKVAETEVQLSELIAALQGVIKRNKAFEHHHIQRELLSTRERMSQILNYLKQQSAQKRFCDFAEFFAPTEGKHGVVVTFLAILELLKAQLITCVQAKQYGHLKVALPEVD